MQKRSWSRHDVLNILAGLLAAKAGPLEAADACAARRSKSAEAYAAGCKAAAGSVLLALGFSPDPLEALAGTGQTATPRGVTTQLWLLEDLENLIVSLYRSMLSAPPAFTSPRIRNLYRRGVMETYQDLLAALGSTVQLAPPTRKRPPREWKELSGDLSSG